SATGVGAPPPQSGSSVAGWRPRAPARAAAPPSASRCRSGRADPEKAPPSPDRLAPRVTIHDVMAILKVARLGHPVLRQQAEPVAPADIRSAHVQQLIDDMIETMHEYDGAGLAANQVHVPRRIAVIEVGKNP